MRSGRWRFFSERSSLGMLSTFLTRSFGCLLVASSPRVFPSTLTGTMKSLSREDRFLSIFSSSPASSSSSVFGSLLFVPSGGPPVDDDVTSGDRRLVLGAASGCLSPAASRCCCCFVVSDELPSAAFAAARFLGLGSSSEGAGASRESLFFSVE